MMMRAMNVKVAFQMIPQTVETSSRFTTPVNSATSAMPIAE